MPERKRKQTRPDVPALEAEIVRLNKIVQALMDRSESSTNVQDSDFGLFQATVMLQDQVRLHTEELEAALHDKEKDEAGAPVSSPEQPGSPPTPTPTRPPSKRPRSPAPPAPLPTAPARPTGAFGGAKPQQTRPGRGPAQPAAAGGAAETAAGAGDG